MILLTFPIIIVTVSNYKHELSYRKLYYWGQNDCNWTSRQHHGCPGTLHSAQAHLSVTNMLMLVLSWSNLSSAVPSSSYCHTSNHRYCVILSLYVLKVYSLFLRTDNAWIRNTRQMDTDKPTTSN